MRTLIIIKIYLIAFFSSGIMSCKEFLSIDPPSNELTSATIFNDSTSAAQALTGLYIYAMSENGLSFGSGALTANLGLAADELTLAAVDANLEEYLTNGVTVLNASNYALWTRAYEYIYRANSCIEGITASKGINSAAKDALVGEARLLRAFYLFNLVNLFENIPLTISTDYSVNRSLNNSTADDVFLQIEDDLKYAKSALKNIPVRNDRGNYDAATALLAKVYLYNKRYDLAFVEADEVIRSTRYHLETPMNTFVADSRETIWKLLPVIPERQTHEGFHFVPGTAQTMPKFVVRSQLYDSFAADDLRKEQWIGTVTIEGQQYRYPSKYRNRLSGTVIKEHSTVLRIAEQYLIRAEASAGLNNLETACADLNLVRAKADLLEIEEDDKNVVVQEIIEERRRELFCEWGNRWFDLKRLNLSESVLGDLKPEWSNTALIFPIPLNELNANPNLKQNPGYME
ncbi:RagB/SusD family nutrient uptake outer membrane protein [Sphingobacterium pedocola]|uniref:RagB/SusD family nutrient uptake outer membrane protein n=1 Tax=Sphingobacterium pedocola TaxID=2082722 RepID=A0ABR9TE95_9SPHI|nr:RagB/SusD family nutrient uptake outer membrane protein [Sphingobacterium pedocola]MBE8722977.1 hypothetical protein [Sphingobacterium pedocola]